MKSLAPIAVVACGLALLASLARSALADRPAAAAAIRCATPAKWRGSGVHAGNWRIGCQVCSSFTLRNLARQLHTARNAVAVAAKYAKGYRLAYRQAPFEGCLYGILHRR